MADRTTELRGEIEQACDELRRALETLSDAELAGPTANAGWTAHDTIAHLASIEMRHREQLRCALDGAAWVQTEDIDAYNARMVQDRRPWTAPQLRAEIEREYGETLKLVDGLRPGDLERTFDHPRRGTMSVEAILADLPRHLRSHLQDVSAGPSQA